MKSFQNLLAACALMFAPVCHSSAQVNITTWQVDLRHSGNNAAETVLTPGNVSSPGNFGLLFSQPLDGQTYGQSLLASGINVGGTAHNVVYVATEHGSLYAYDADSNTGSNANALWQVALLPSGTVPVPQSVVGSADIPVELGITTTPVIDVSSGTIYIVSKVQRSSDNSYHQYLYALDLATGAAKFNSPVEINPTFGGTATDSFGGVIAFSALHEHLRCAMALYNGVIYLAYASHSDTNPYHGEVIGYDATTLQVVKTFITTPNNGDSEGGIWQSGSSPAVDASGNMYIAVGNGAWDQKNPSYGTDWGESILKLPTTGAFTVSYANTLNWFTPSNWQTLNDGDLDLGSGGLLLLPDQTGPHQHIMVGGGKGAVLYVVDRDNLGGMHTPDNAIQEIPEVGGDWIFSTPAYYNGYIYYSASGGPLEQRAVGYNAVDGTYVATPPITSAETFNNKGSGCFISSNGATNGIIWILNGAGIRAYDAANVSSGMIYTANATLPGNISCQNTKFSLPMVANGKLYYTGYSNTNTGHLLVYGLLPTAVGTPAAPSNAAAAANSSTTVTVSWTSNSTNESGFKIKRSTSATANFSQVGATGPGVTTFVDSGLNPLVTYYYQVLATNVNGDSNASNVASTTTFPAYAENGLVAYWSMDETTGTTVKDATANAHNGTINGEAGLATGFINNGVSLHGTGQATSNITVANKSDLQFAANQSFTVSAWVLPGALRNSEETVIAKSRDQGNYYGIWINASNQWAFRGPGGDVVGSTATQATWTHVTAVQDGVTGTRVIYVNGVLVGSGAAQAADGVGTLWMGQQNVAGAYESLPGTLDEVRIYNRALAVGEITNLIGPPVLAAVSSLTQGAGHIFGLPIWPYTAAKIEPRKGATIGQYNLVLNFSAPVSGIVGILKRLDGAATVGTISAPSYDATGKVVTFTLSGMGNAQALNLHLSGVVPGNATADIPFNILWGDVNSDNIVSSLDASISQHNHSTLVNNASASMDVNCDGVVNATDDALISNAVGTSLSSQTDTNLAIFQPATALSSLGGNTPDQAFDQDLVNTRWESTQKVDPEWIYVNLGSVCNIHSVVLTWENAAGQNYNIDVSNNATDWTKIVSVTGNTTAGSHPYPNLNATGQYVRMYGTTRTTDYGYSLYDFQVLGVAGGGGYAPTVNSATTTTATVNTAFIYQITATNIPTTFNATNLPAGLSINTATGVISGVVNQQGAYSVTVSATNANGTLTAPLTITALTPYGTWQNTNFTSAELSDPKVSGLTATPAGDGISNLMKYALNLNPKINGTNGLPTKSMISTGGANYLALKYTQVIAANDLTYAVEVSSDLLTWNAGSSYTMTTSMPNADGKTMAVTAQDLTPLTSGAKRFIRLKISEP